MSLEFPGMISLQIQVTTKDFESLNPLLNYTSVIATLVGGGREKPPIRDKNHH